MAKKNEKNNKTVKITKEQVLKKLEEVIDPELKVNIVDLGLIYEVEFSKKNVKITMTFTTPACPLMPFIAGQVESKLKELGYADPHVHVTWNPPWSPEKMSEKAKAILGM